MRNYVKIYLLTLFLVLTGATELVYAQLGSFAERKKFNVESDSVSGTTDLTNFPVLINITNLDFRTTANGGDVENSNGFDIAFTAADGTTQLDHDLESYNSGTGELIAWVRFPSLSATNDTQFFIYYGDSGITTDQSTSGTWNADYQLVMHMDGGATESDATSNGNDGTENGTGGIPTTTGRIGDGRDFERGDSDFISVPDDNSLDITSEITISFWYNPESTNAPDMVTKGTNTSYEATFRGGPRMQFKKEGGSNLTADASFSLSTSTWYYFTYVQSTSGRAIFQNGVEINSDGNTNAFSTNNDALQISRSADAADGIIDEVRISDVDRSADWIATEYKNQLNPSTFITELDDLPSLENIESTAATYTAGGSAIFITSALTIGSHPTITTLDSAVIQISGNLDNPDDQLGFSDQLGITGTYTASNGKLLLSGTASLSNYQTALRAVTFSSIAGTPSQLTRTVSITGYNGSSATNTPVRDIDIIITLTDLTTDISNAVFHLDAQDLDGDGTPNSSEGSPPLNGSSVSIWNDISTNNFAFETGTAAIFDSLGFGERGAVEYDGVNDELQEAADALINNSLFTEKSFAFTFRTGNDVSGFQVIYEQASGARGYNFTIVDGTLYAQAYSRGDANWGASNALRHRVLDLGTVQTNESYILIAYHNSNEWAAQVNNGFLESFDDADDMPSVSENVAAGGNVGNTRNPVTLANENGNFNGQIVEFASWNTTLNGGQRASLYNYFNDKWGNVPPVLAGIEGANIDFTEGDPDTQITNTITVSDSDPHNNMDSAKVSITTNFISGQDSLIFANTANITGTYDGATGVLLLSGSDTKANYQAALRAVNYRNTQFNPSTNTRTVEFNIYDWDDVSNTVSRDINISDPASTPVLADIEGGDLAYTEGDGSVSVTSAITVSDADDTNMESAIVSITANYFLGEDILDFTDTGNITGNFAVGSGILTLTGSDTKANYQAALRAVTYENTSSDPVNLDRTISFVINDGDNDSNTQSRDITVAAVNSKPVLSSIESSNLSYPDEAVQITNTIVVTDPDDTRLDSALVIISENLKPAEDSLIYSTLFGITGNWNPNTGILKLTGNNLLSDYEAALRSVDYINTATIASGPERVVSFIVSDGELKSDTLKRTIDVSPVETIPDLEVWLRADAGISEGDGVAVTTWADQSGNGNDYTGTAGSGSAPTFVASSASLNSKPSVSFVGNGDHFLDSDGQTNYINSNTEFSLFIVYKSDVTNTDKGLFIADSPSGADEILTIRYDASGANGGGSFNDVVKTGILGNNPDNQLESFSDIQTTSAQIISLQWESGTTYDLFVDGILNNPSSAADPPPSGTITTATTALLGKGGKDTGNNSWDGEIAEFIFYSRSISQTERESIEDYLADKYDQAIRKLTPATGGAAISADDANTTYTSLTGPFVQEGFIGEYTSSGTFVLTAPSGFEWNTGGTIGVTESPAFGGSTELDASFTSVTASAVTFTVDVASSTNPGQLEFTGLEIRPTTGTIPNTGNITNTGTTGQGGGTNYGTINMIPGANDSLIFVQQPSTTNVDSSITPAVRVQLVDQFGNSIEQSGVDISIALSPESSGNLNQSTPIETNALGISEFDTLAIDAIGTKRLVATSLGLNADTSSTFEIVNAGTLTSFLIERVPSGNISSKTAGQSFNIKITAIDGTSTTVTTFNGTVVISSSCTMDTGQGTSANFSSGVLSSTSVSITSVGSCTITATKSAGSEFGTSNSFLVSAGAASEATSLITASPTVILNDGSSTSVITVDLKDEFGNNVTTGGDAVTIATTTGTLASTSGSVIDNSDGTYSDTLTSTMVAETATITGTVNASSITDNATVEFAAFTHIWDSQLGSASLASDWEDTGNWNVGTIPGPSSVVFIPATPDVGNEQPVVDVAGATVSSLSMETGASLTISGGINFTITGTLSGGSILGSNVDSLTVGGDILDVTTINVGTVVLDGSTTQTITNPHTYTNLVIDNANGVLVQQNLSISDSLTMTSGELLIPSGANLVVEGIKYGTGVLRFQRRISGVRGWRILSSPVSSTYGDFLDGTLTQGYSGSTLGNAPLDSLQPNVLTYLESFVGTDNQRYRAPSNASTSLTEGQGVFVFFFGDVAGDARYNNPLPDTLDVSGQEFNGTAGEVDFGVTYTADADTGWNLIGNPFGATIDWDDTPNWTKTNIESTIYVWDPAANGGNGEYLTWNGTTGTLGSGLIAPFQGFWIKASAASPVLRVTTDAKTTGGAFLRKEVKTNPAEEVPLVTLELTSSGLRKEANFMFSEDASKGKDVLDAFELLPLTENRLEIFSVLDDNTPLVINNLPAVLSNRYLIPVDINGYIEGIPISGDFKVRAINLDNIPDEWLISLIDNDTETEINLLEQEEYTFFHSTKAKAKTANPSSQRKVVAKKTNDTRFTLKITTEEIEANIPQDVFLNQNYPNPFNPSTTIPFGLDLDSKVSLVIYDILGRKVATLIDRNLTAGTYNETFRASHLASGVYFYRLTTDSKTIVKKFTLIK